MVSSRTIIILSIFLLVTLVLSIISTSVGLAFGVAAMLVLVTRFEYNATRDFFTPLIIFVGFFMFFYYLPYLRTILLGHYWLIYETPTKTANRTLGILFIGFIAFTMGYYFIAPRRWVDRLYMLKSGEQSLNRSLGLMAGISLLLVGLFCFITFIHLSGGIGRVLQAPNWGKLVEPDRNKLYWFGLNMALFSGFTCYFAGRTRIRRYDYLLPIVLVSIFGILHSKKRILAVILIMIIFYNAYHRRFSLRDVALVGILFVGVVALYRPIELIMFGADNESIFRHLTGGVLSNMIYSTLFMTHMGQISGIPQTIPYQWGGTLVNDILPYAIRTYPPIENMVGEYPSAQRINTLVTVGPDQWENKGLVSGIFGEFYINFGIAGVLASGLLLGLFSRFSYEIWRYRNRSFFAAAIYPLLVYYLVNMLFKTPYPWNMLRLMAPILFISTIWFIGNRFFDIPSAFKENPV